MRGEGSEYCGWGSLPRVRGEGSEGWVLWVGRGGAARQPRPLLSPLFQAPLRSPLLSPLAERPLPLPHTHTTHPPSAADGDYKVKIVQRGAVGPLIEMLGSTDPQLREMAAFALGRLAQHADNQAGVVASGGLPPLLDLLETCVPNLQVGEGVGGWGCVLGVRVGARSSGLCDVRGGWRPSFDPPPHPRAHLAPPRPPPLAPAAQRGLCPVWAERERG